MRNPFLQGAFICYEVFVRSCVFASHTYKQGGRINTVSSDLVSIVVQGVDMNVEN